MAILGNNIYLGFVKSSQDLYIVQINQAWQIENTRIVRNPFIAHPKFKSV